MLQFSFHWRVVRLRDCLFDAARLRPGFASEPNTDLPISHDVAALRSALDGNGKFYLVW
jgi:hypothetical protein